MGLSLAAAGVSSSAGAAMLRSLIPGSALVTQVGALVDVERIVLARVTQAGALADMERTVLARVTQAGALADMERTVLARVTQAGALADVERTTPARVTQAGMMVDARYRRPASTLNCWEFHVDDPVGNYLAFLDGAFGKAYMATLSDVGSGKFTIHADDPKATAANLAVGNIVKVRYRNVDIGAWVMETIDNPLVDSGEEAARLITVSGRGLLALLDKGIVYPGDLADAGTAERQFSGVTKASILLALYEEFVERGGGELSPDFSSMHDSVAIPFADSVALNYKAGQTLLDVARNLAGLGLELTADPDRTLRAWNTAGTDRSATVIFRHGQTMLRAKQTTEGAGLTNAVLGEGQNVFVESTDATSIASFRRREGYLAVRNTADSGQVGAANALLLAGWKNPRAAYELEVINEPFYPFFDYGIGDLVRIEIPGRVTGNYRVLGISMSEVEGPCDLRVVLEINDLATEYLQKLQRAFDVSLLSVRPGPGAASSLASSGTEPTVGSGGTGLADDAVKASQIDFGTGTNQVDAGVLPVADVDGRFTATDAEGALAELATSRRFLLGPWTRDDVAAGLTSVALELNESSVRTEAPMVRAGSILGLAVRSNEARSAGSLTAEVTMNGVATELQAMLDGAHVQDAQATQAFGVSAFAAGTRIGVTITSSVDWAPTTADISVMVEVAT